MTLKLLHKNSLHQGTKRKEGPKREWGNCRHNWRIQGFTWGLEVSNSLSRKKGGGGKMLVWQ